ncbi:MAG: PQQ-like beta-propeller repeat protein [Armatimonadetes bacterium]|nr:PQQ-like beta-propeller repeat protein [Armatimonadota bacterium]
MDKLIPGAFAVLGALLLGLWLATGRQAGRFTERVPQPLPPGRSPGSTAPVNLAGRFLAFDGLPAADLPGSWPRFRGERLDNIAADAPPLARSWGSGGPAVLWSRDLGEGYAGAAVRNGRVYVLDYDQAAQTDALRCLSLEDGREVWRRAYPVKIKRNHGMSRTVPAVTERFVVTLGPKCHVLCVEAATGKYLWGLDLVRQFRARVPVWYAGQCPLIEGDRVILAPGGSALLMAVDAATGKVLWKTPNPRQWTMTHSSVLPVEFNGRRMYVYCASGGVVGVSAADGSLLWETTEWKISIANVPTPVAIGEGRLLLTGGYNAGGMILQLEESEGRITAKVAARFKPAELGAEQQTPIFYEDHIYAVLPSGQPSSGQLVCLDAEGERRWASGNTRRFGLGPFLIADGLIFVMNDSGLLTLAEATPGGYRQLAQARVLQGHDSWGPLALAGDRLLARDLTRMVCLDVGQ